jgi:benzodiazapine receptor
VLNFASALSFYEWEGLGIPEVTWTVTMIAVAALIAGYTSRRYRDVAYAGVVVWAFIALTIKHWGAGTQVLSYVGGAVVLLFLALMVWNGRERLAAAR